MESLEQLRYPSMTQVVDVENRTWGCRGWGTRMTFLDSYSKL